MPAGRRVGWLAGLGLCATLMACAAPQPTTGSAPGAAAVTTAAATDTAAAGTPAPPLADCTAGALPTVTDGVLTFASGSPMTAPWFVGADPAAGQGLEAATADAVAGALGYGADRVSWVSVDRASVVAGTATGFDVALGQFVEPDEAGPSGEPVDYSTGYFSVTDAVLMRAGSVAPDAAELAGLRLGRVGARPLDDGSSPPTGVSMSSFPTDPDGISALSSGSVDGLLMGIHDALAAAAADPAVMVVGQLPPDPAAQPVQLRAVLPAGSELTGCVSAAIDRLRVEGTLDALAARWVTSEVPVLR